MNKKISIINVLYCALKSFECDVFLSPRFFLVIHDFDILSIDIKSFIIEFCVNNKLHFDFNPNYKSSFYIYERS